MLRSTSELRTLWAPPCSPPYPARTLVPGVRVGVNAAIGEAVAALGSVLQAHAYAVRPGDTGAYNCRPITGGTSHSLHSYGIAVDVNWDTNPYRHDKLVTDIPRPVVDDVYRIRTSGGQPVWRWGGDWGDATRPHSAYDAMHFEIVASPDEVAAGIDWDTVAQPPRDVSRPSTWPVLHPGDRGPTVRELQARLSVAVDGIFGPNTQAAVQAYQTSHGLTPDGIVGLGTWTALLSGQPPVAPNVPSPVKLQAPGPAPEPANAV